MRDYATEMSRLATELRRVRRQLRVLPRDLEQLEHQIMSDDDLTTEARKIKLRQVRDEKRAQQQKLHQQQLAALAKARNLAKDIRVLRPIDEPAQARVRDLRSRGLSYSQIIDRAVANGDDETVAAVRWDAMYHGDEHGFQDASDTIRACDRALADIGRGGERDNNAAILTVEEAAKAIDKLDEFAAKAVHGSVSPHDRLTLAYALGPEEDDA